MNILMLHIVRLYINTSDNSENTALLHMVEITSLDQIFSFRGTTLIFNAVLRSHLKKVSLYIKQGSLRARIDSF